MTSKERLINTFKGLPRDRTPILGGWLACPEHVRRLAGVNEETYWQDPVQAGLAAEHKLGSDGLIGIYTPKNRGDFRLVDKDSYKRADSGLDLDDVLSSIESADEPEKMLADFQEESEYAQFKASLIQHQKLAGDMLWMPAQWSAAAKVTWYGDFGYENFFLIVGGYPAHAQKLMTIGGMQGHLRSRLIARAVREGIYPPAVLFGEDICTQRGPMISPAFLEKYYMPQLRFGLEPLLEAGCKPVWHCDGDVRPLLDMLIDCGIKGFQGFQPECGMTLNMIMRRRTRDKEPLLIFGPVAVTTELPVLTAKQVKQRVIRAIEACKDYADLVLFTSNTINPDVPFENLIAMYEAITGE